MSDHDQEFEVSTTTGLADEGRGLSSDDGKYFFTRGDSSHPELEVLDEGTGTRTIVSDSAMVALFDLGMALARRQSGLEEAVQASVRTLHIARSLLKEAMRNEMRIMAPNEYARKIHSIAQKIGANYEEVELLLTSIVHELADEMTRPQPKANARRKRR